MRVVLQAADFEQNVADYGLAVAIAILAVLLGVTLIWQSRKDVARTTQRFTDYLMEVGARQTEALVASANASQACAEMIRQEGHRAEKRHADAERQQTQRHHELVVYLSTIEQELYERGERLRRVPIVAAVKAEEGDLPDD